MKTKKLDGVEVWKEFEDVATRFKLNIIDRAVYSYLLLHTRLEGKLRLHFSLLGLGRGIGISRDPVRASIRRLADHGVLRSIERTSYGQLVEVRLPAEVPVTRLLGTPNATSVKKLSAEPNLDKLDFLRNPALRQSIHDREGGMCFYCLRRTPSRAHCLDHVVPVAKSGQNSYRNLVSSCIDCNSRKRDLFATDFLRLLYREGSLSRNDLTRQLRKLQSLASGNLRPVVAGL